MTEPMSDADIARHLKTWRPGSHEAWCALADKAAARIEALVAERDAAVEMQRNLSGMVDVAVGLARDNGIPEGRRRATAEIVAWLRSPVMGGDNAEPVAQTHADIADAIERGEHLKGEG